jgi:hypothetical protein
MSMHLVGPWMSTTNTKKRKQNKTKRQLQADIDHNKWLKKMGVSNQRSVAQSGSVSGLGPEGRKFESYHSDQIPLSNKIVNIKSNKMVDTETKLQAYNKGGIQVLSREETDDPATGKRR